MRWQPAWESNVWSNELVVETVTRQRLLKKQLTGNTQYVL
jgi:hypothetical protein